MATIFSNKDPASVAAAVVKQANLMHDAIYQQGASGVANFTGSGGYFHRDVTSVQGTGINFQSIDFQDPNVTASVAMVVNPFTVGVSGTYAVAIDLQKKLYAHFLDDSAHMTKDVVNALYSPFPNSALPSGSQQLPSGAANATGILSIPVPSSNKDVTGTFQFLNSIQAFFNAHLTQSTPSGLRGPGQIQVHVLNDVLNSYTAASGTSTGTAATLAAGLASGVSAHLLSGPAVGRIRLI